MNPRSLLFAAVWCGGFEALAQNAAPVYLRADIGPAFQSDLRVKIPNTPQFDVQTRNGVRFDVAVGYKIQECWAVELETGTAWTQLNTVAQHNFFQVPVMANLVWNYPGKRFRPFIRAGVGGVGVIAVPGDSMYPTDTDFTCGGQAAAGIRYRFSKHFDSGLGYNLLMVAPTTLGSADLGTILTHSVSASVAFHF